MKSNYKIKVNNDYTFEIDANTMSLDVSQVSEHHHHVLKNNQAFDVKVKTANFNAKSYDIEVNGNDYTVQIKDGLDQLISEMGFSIGNTKMVDAIKAPMPGLILEVLVSEGQEVTEGENLVILEAMKMENVITSPRDGVIKSIDVKQGDAIDKNALILKFK